MAINAENLSVSGVKNIVSEGRSAYADLMGDNSKVDVLEATLKRIDSLLDWLIAEQNNLCNKMGVKDLEEFKSKFNQAVNDLNLNRVTGSELKKYFLDSFKAAAGKYDVENKQIETLAQQLLDELMEVFGSNEGVYLDDVIKRFHGLLLEAVVSETGAKIDFRALTRAAIAIDGENGAEIINDAITPTIKARLKTLLKLVEEGKTPTRDDFRTLDKIDISKFKSNGNPIEIDIESEWLTLTEAMTSNKLEAYLEEMPANKRKAFLKEINNSMTDYICRQLNLTGDNEVKNAIQAMLKTKLTGSNNSQKIVKNMENMFFVGTADKEVTGLLGEIAAYAALKRAFGSKAKLKWAAQALEGGKQLSIDIVLNDMFGVQVKNTTKDLNQINYAENAIAKLGITFVDKSAYDVIHQLTDSDALSKAYESSYFNISYTIDHDKQPHVIAGSSPDFDGIASDLVNLREDIKIFLYQFSPEMIYMANNGDAFAQLATLDNSLQSLKGNLVYIVGNQPVFASEMLIRIRNQIDNLIKELSNKEITTPENAFRISGSHSQNIVNYLNDRAKKGEPVGLEKQGALVGVNVIKLTSSFRF